MFCKSLKQRQVENYVVILNSAVIRWIKVNSCGMLVLPKGNKKTRRSDNGYSKNAASQKAGGRKPYPYSGILQSEREMNSTE